MADKRKRDYRLEEERRNIRARALGFSSRAQMRKAREKGAIPRAKEFRENRAEAEARTRAYAETARQESFTREQYVPRRGELSLAQIKSENERWSNRHSRQTVTQWSPRWGEKRQRLYHEAFVQWWEVPNDERNFIASYEYLQQYGNVPPEAFKDNPYRSR